MNATVPGGVPAGEVTTAERLIESPYVGVFIGELDEIEVEDSAAVIVAVPGAYEMV
jgi:hypothetical protein